MGECSGEKETNCREDLIGRITQRPTTWGIVKIMSLPLSIMGIIIVLVSLVYHQNAQLNSAAVNRLSDIVVYNKELNLKQEDRIRATEINQASFTEQVKGIAVSLHNIERNIEDIRKGQKQAR